MSVAFLAQLIQDRNHAVERQAVLETRVATLEAAIRALLQQWREQALTYDDTTSTIQNVARAHLTECANQLAALEFPERDAIPSACATSSCDAIKGEDARTSRDDQRMAGTRPTGSRSGTASSPLCVCGHDERYHEDAEGGTHECWYHGCSCQQFVERV